MADTRTLRAWDAIQTYMLGQRLVIETWPTSSGFAGTLKLMGTNAVQYRTSGPGGLQQTYTDLLDMYEQGKGAPR